MAKNRKSMASNASKTLRNKRASKVSKSLAGSVLAKSKYTPQKKAQDKKSTATKKNCKRNTKQR